MKAMTESRVLMFALALAAAGQALAQANLEINTPAIASLQASMQQRHGQLAGLYASGRAALYREIARANGKPEWENDIRATFAQRWIEKAQAGWYYQNTSGAWVRK